MSITAEQPPADPQGQQVVRVFLCGDVMTGRGIDQVLPHPCDPLIHESFVKSARDYVRLAEHFTLGAGGLLAVNFVPDGLAPLYGGHNPVGAMGFLRLKLD